MKKKGEKKGNSMGVLVGSIAVAIAVYYLASAFVEKGSSYYYNSKQSKAESMDNDDWGPEIVKKGE